jgi:hypothetical protein
MSTEKKKKNLKILRGFLRSRCMYRTTAKFLVHHFSFKKFSSGVLPNTPVCKCVHTFILYTYHFSSSNCQKQGCKKIISGTRGDIKNRGQKETIRIRSRTLCKFHNCSYVNYVDYTRVQLSSVFHHTYIIHSYSTAVFTIGLAVAQK